MKATNAVFAAALALTLSSQATLAESQAPVNELDTSALFADAFSLSSVDQILALDEADMESTRGEMWPFIVSVATLDFAMAGYFWGVYVPTVTEAMGGGPCTTCELPKGLPK